jgi:hypothetical protein
LLDDGLRNDASGSQQHSRNTFPALSNIDLDYSAARGHVHIDGGSANENLEIYKELFSHARTGGELGKE